MNESSFKKKKDVAFACDWLAAMEVISRYYNHHEAHPTSRNVAVEILMWDSLMIQAMSLLDHALKFAKVGGRDLKDRIDRSSLTPTRKADAHRVRKLRNKVGHDPSDLNRESSEVQAKAIEAIRVVRLAVSEIGFLDDPNSTFEFFAIQEAAKGSELPDVWMEQGHSYGAKKNGTIFIEYRWTTNYFNR